MPTSVTFVPIDFQLDRHDLFCLVKAGRSPNASPGIS